jgi:hypothetical protein
VEIKKAGRRTRLFFVKHIDRRPNLQRTAPSNQLKGLYIAGEFSFVIEVSSEAQHTAMGARWLLVSYFAACFRMRPRPVLLDFANCFSGMLKESQLVQTISIGGEGGIRTHGGLTSTAVFKTAALNRSATSP